MSSRLNQILDQISDISNSITSQDFAAPKIFTNAILNSTDIYSVIRDPLPHERVLFTVPSLTQHTAYTGPARAPRRNTAVAAMLGNDMVEQLRRGGGGGVGGGIGGPPTGEVDVEVLLDGAQKLINIYPLPGAVERISQLRNRFYRLTNSISALESLVNDQKVQLDLVQRQHEPEDYVDSEEKHFQAAGGHITDDMLRKEEEEIEELERHKREMEEELKRMDLEMGRSIRGRGHG